MGFQLGTALGAGTEMALKVKQLQDQEAQNEAEMKIRQDANAREQAESAIRLRTANQAESDQQALRAAAAPMQDGAGGVAAPTSADNRDIGQPDGPSLSNGQLVQGTAAQANSPQAVMQRQQQVLTSQGRPDAAIKLGNDASAAQDATRERARKIYSEGIEDAARAARTGDVDQFTKAFNAKGDMKVSNVTVTPKKINIPGIGDITSYDYTGTLTKPDGTTQQGTINSHDLSMGLLPYKDHLEELRKGNDTASKGELRIAQGDAAQARGQAQMALGEAALARVQSATSGQGVKEVAEQRKQATALLQDSSRQISETQKAINALRKNAVLIQPGSPEESELSGLQEQLQMHQQNYGEARSQLAKLDTTGGKNPPAAAPAAPAGKPVTGGRAPTIASVQGAPKGSTIGASTPKGWEVKDSTVKVVGYVRS